MRTRSTLRDEVRRVECSDCCVVAEAAPWARSGSRFMRGFEDTCVWLARAAPKIVVAQLRRVDWATVGQMSERVVDEHTAARHGDGLTALPASASTGSPTPGATAYSYASSATTRRAWFGPPGALAGSLICLLYTSPSP